MYIISPGTQMVGPGVLTAIFIGQFAKSVDH